ncbi:ABC transporter substrate-binding protein [uncultured Methylobacterium sp.]|uniref:ABC transporter substrate-binding protein n=1 Tax=uncultured Methylobacterium sp. TaxID=157278 RepID=UPI0035CAE47B
MLVHRPGTTVSCDDPGASSRGATRRRWLGRLCACCIGAALAPAGLALLERADRAEAATAQGTIRVGHLPAGCVSHLLLAKKRGLFEKAGINAQLTQFNGPADNILALQSGNLDVIHNPWTTTVAAFADGSDNLRIVGGSGLAGIELVARSGTVKNVGELAAAAGQGLRVGTLKLDTLELVTYGTMAMHGRSYRDYAMQFFPSMVGMGEAISSAAMDVVSLAQPYAQSVVAQNGAVYLASSNDVWGPEAPDCVMTTTVDVMRAKADLLTAYMKVLVQGAHEFYADFDGAVADLQPIYGAPKEILEVALRRQAPNPIIRDAGAYGLRNAVKYLIDLGYMKTNVADGVLALNLQPA